MQSGNCYWRDTFQAMASVSMDIKSAFVTQHLRVGTLTRDTVVRAFVILLALSPMPLLFPLLSGGTRALQEPQLIGIAFQLAMLAVLGMRARRETIPARRWFWILILLGCGSWLALTVTGLLAGTYFPLQATIYESVGQLPYLLFYAGLIPALELQPCTRQDSVPYTLRFLGWLGPFILIFSLLTYFLALPEIWLGGTERLWSHSMALFVALDTYIVVRLWHLISHAVTSQWRTIYSWLFVAALTWGAGDLLHYLVSEEVMAYQGWSAALVMVWPVACTAIVIAARTFEVERSVVIPVAAPYYPLGMGPLAIYVVSPLLLHVTLYHFGDPDAALRPGRDSLVLLSTALLAGLALLYHRLLRVENYRLAVEEVQSRKQMEHLAFHDELTGLPNRSLFLDRLKAAIAEARRHGTRCAVLFCDLDNFKVINDSLGHQIGDQILVAAAGRMRNSVSAQDTVARLGGDEFAVIVRGLRDGRDAATTAEKLLDCLGSPLVVDDRRHVLNGSVGIAVFPDDGREEEILLKHADTAMYQAKSNGRNTYRLFTPAMHDAARERLAIEQGLREGLLEDQLTLYYQPIINLESGQAETYEALARWHHPEKGFIPPVSFIDVAEQTGLIVELGQWVLESACAWAAQLEETGGPGPGISVNISMRQLQDPGFVDSVQRVLRQSGLAPERLMLEITESMALTIDYTTEILAQLRETGVRIAIDDFGTGYASLSRLQELPVDIVKIDKSFIRGTENGAVSQAIVQAIVSMSRALDFYVIAEGVETELELHRVTKWGCDGAQGFHICHPLPPQELLHWQSGKLEKLRA